MISSSSKIAIVDTSLGMEVLCFANRLDAVLSLIENARISPEPGYYGSPSHEAAVKQVRDHCDATLKAIEDDRKEEAEIANGERRAE